MNSIENNNHNNENRSKEEGAAEQATSMQQIELVELNGRRERVSENMKLEFVSMMEKGFHQRIIRSVRDAHTQIDQKC